MNLYRISQTQRDGYDTFDAAIVAAEDADVARRIHPRQSWGEIYGDDEWRDGGENDAWTRDTWAWHPDNVTAEFVGVAAEGTARGVILASFNAG